ncbi:hypothetical protein PCE1_000793 [Barthelona sp. PCE]
MADFRPFALKLDSSNVINDEYEAEAKKIVDIEVSIPDEVSIPEKNETELEEAFHTVLPSAVVNSREDLNNTDLHLFGVIEGRLSFYKQDLKDREKEHQIVKDEHTEIMKRKASLLARKEELLADKEKVKVFEADIEDLKMSIGEYELKHTQLLKDYMDNYCVLKKNHSKAILELNTLKDEFEKLTSKYDSIGEILFEREGIDYEEFNEKKDMIVDLKQKLIEETEDTENLKNKIFEKRKVVDQLKKQYTIKTDKKKKLHRSLVIASPKKSVSTPVKTQASLLEIADMDLTASASDMDSFYKQKLFEDSPVVENKIVSLSARILKMSGLESTDDGLNEHDIEDNF